jgi:lipopolysaccharide export system protein LptC
MDAFMENFTTRQLDAQGKTQYELQARYMAHFPADNHSEFQVPHLTLYRDSGERWTLQSESALAENGDERITLQGTVHIQQHPLDVRRQGVLIDTRELRVLPTASYAETGELAEISQGIHKMTAVGLQAYFDEDRLQLLSQVRGLYETQP